MEILFNKWSSSMKLSKYFLLFSLFTAIAAFAQVQMSVQENFSDGQNFELNMNLEFSEAPAVGFFIQLPADVKATPSRIQMGEQEFWLKNEKTIPVQSNVVHWNLEGDQLLFLFQRGIIVNGNRLNITFHSFVQSAQRNNVNLSVHTIQQQSGQEFTAGAELNTAQLFQTENNEIR